MLFIAALAGVLPAEQVHVARKQGNLHGFLLLEDANGKVLAGGDQTYEVHGSYIRSRTLFRFRDGSIDDEEATFHQGSVFKLTRDHHIQKGPSFPHPMDLTIDVSKGEVFWKDLSKKDGQAKTRHMKLTSDLANGILPLLVENFPQGVNSLTVPYVAFADKPRLVKMIVTRDGSDKVTLGPEARRADRFKIHMDIGGIAGVVAPLAGKQPPDLHMWVVAGPVPVFVRLEGPLYAQGPVWNILLSAPNWPAESPSGRPH